MYIALGHGGGDFPEGQCTGGGNVKGINAFRHGNPGDVVTFIDGLGKKAVTFAAHDKGKSFRTFKGGITDGYRFIPKGQGDCFKA